jgi:TRAP-type mannitol/chloroaromatic compound transport system permease small subunit
MDPVIRLLDRITIGFAKLVAVLVIPMVLLVFANALLRYVFGYGSVWLYESVIYCFVLVMAGLAGWTLTANEHVRVDILYAALPPRFQGLIDLVGAMVMMAPFLWLMWDRSLPYVQRSWGMREGSMEISGIPYVWLLKTALLIFVVVLAIAGLSFVLRAIQKLTGARA